MPQPKSTRPTPPTPSPEMHKVLLSMPPVMIAEHFPVYTQYFLISEATTAEPPAVSS